MSAACLETSEPAIPMAMPMSAFFSAGESFTPSPVTATMAPWGHRGQALWSRGTGHGRAWGWSYRGARDGDTVGHSDSGTMVHRDWDIKGHRDSRVAWGRGKGARGQGQGGERGQGTAGHEDRDTTGLGAPWGTETRAL